MAIEVYYWKKRGRKNKAKPWETPALTENREERVLLACVMRKLPRNSINEKWVETVGKWF